MKKQSKLEGISNEDCLNKGSFTPCGYCSKDGSLKYSCTEYYTPKMKRNNLYKKIGLSALAVAPPIIGGVLGYAYQNPDHSPLVNILAGAGGGFAIEMGIGLIILLGGVISQVGSEWEGL